MRYAAAIFAMLGAASCRQILGLDPGSVAPTDGDIGADVAIDDMPPIDEMMIDASSNGWGNLAVVPESSAGDQDPTLTADMLEMYFSRNDRIYFMTRTSTASAWSAAAAATFSNGQNFDASPEITDNGLGVLFASDRGAGPDIDIHFVLRSNRTTAWSAVNAMAVVSLDTFDDRPGSIGANGLRFVMSSTRAGSDDIFEASRASESANFGTPVITAISSGNGNEIAPYMTPDGLSLYYAASTPVSPQNDLYVATRATLSDAWGNATKITELSSPTIDSDPWVSADGKQIYFSSDRSGVLRIYHASR